MMKLSPRAMRFVDAAVMRSESDQIRAVWNAFKCEPVKELPDEVAQAVLGALQQADRHLRSRLESSSLGEDEAADLSNDLGFICAIKRDLEQQLSGCSATRQGLANRLRECDYPELGGIYAQTLEQRLADLGYVQGRNIVLLRRFAGPQMDKMEEAISSL